jgi:hypothetical protein
MEYPDFLVWCLNAGMTRAQAANLYASTFSGPSTFTWANKPPASAVPTGTEILVSDVGNVGATRWLSDGALWRLAGQQDLVVDFTASPPSATNTSEQVLKTLPALPAGVLMSLRYFSLKVLTSKSGTAETLSARFRIGLTGLTGDASMGTNTALTGTSRNGTCEWMFFASSTTQLRGVGRDPGFGAPGFNSGTATSVYPTNNSVSDMSTNALIMSITVQMSAGVETGTVAHAILTGF